MYLPTGYAGSAGTVKDPLSLAESRRVARRQSARLVVEVGEDVGKAYVLQPGSPIEIGSSPGASLCFEGLGVAPRHVVIEADEGRFCLCPVSETHGTSVNGRRVERCHRLAHRDLISVGALSLRFLLEDVDDVRQERERLPVRPATSTAPTQPATRRLVRRSSAAEPCAARAPMAPPEEPAVEVPTAEPASVAPSAEPAADSQPARAAAAPARPARGGVARGTARFWNGSQLEEIWSRGDDPPAGTSGRWKVRLPAQAAASPVVAAEPVSSEPVPVQATPSSEPTPAPLSETSAASLESRQLNPILRELHGLVFRLGQYAPSGKSEAQGAELLAEVGRLRNQVDDLHKLVTASARHQDRETAALRAELRALADRVAANSTEG